MIDQSLLLEAVADVARLAGKAALDLFATPVHVERKGDGSPVTQADRNAERVARDWIEKRFPDHGIVGEEMGVVKPDAEYRWFIDPIDGTQSFIHGVPLWGTLVGVARGAEILAGAINCPAVGELVSAATGAGCWRNGTRTWVSDTNRLSAATVLTSDERYDRHPDRRAAWRDLAAQARVSRTWGDCYGYMLLATGRADAMADPVMSPWDVAALHPVILEAGGVITDWNGRPTAFGDGTVATNAALSVEVRTVLGVPQDVHR